MSLFLSLGFLLRLGFKARKEKKKAVRRKGKEKVSLGVNTGTIIAQRVFSTFKRMPSQALLIELESIWVDKVLLSFIL